MILVVLFVFRKEFVFCLLFGLNEQMATRNEDSTMAIYIEHGEQTPDLHACANLKGQQTYVKVN